MKRSNLACLFAALALLLAASAGYAQQDPGAGYSQRIAQFQPILQKAKSRKQARSAAELILDLKTVQKIYLEWVPQDYNRAIGLESRQTWSQMKEWYRLASQEVVLMSSEAGRLNKSCHALGEKAAPAGAEAQKTLAAARKTLKFIDEAPWGDSLREAVFGTKETRDSAARPVHLNAIKEWAKLAKCASGK